MINKSDILKNAKEAADYILGKISVPVDTALILGTGLGGFADKLKITVQIPYSDIPYFPVSTAPDHKGQLVLASTENKNLLIMQGRIHYYEGYSMDEVVFPVRVMKLLGIKSLIITNAAGAINEDMSVGDLMLISDHIKFFNDTPLRGKNIDEFGPRFNDMSDVYTKKLRQLVKHTAESLSIPIREGVYSYMPGPCFETPAEIRMLKALGADAVGMSTVPEAICASHSGINIIGMSFLTNMAAGIYDKIEDLKFTEDSVKNFEALIKTLIDKI